MASNSRAAVDSLAQLAIAGRTLYRRILRLHRERLPGQMRDLGDSYVRAEFGSHFRSKSITVQQAHEFFMQWRGYLAMLSGAADGVTASTAASQNNARTTALASSGIQDLAAAVDSVRQVSEGLHVYASPEQRLRMEALKKEASLLGSAMMIEQQQQHAADGNRDK